MGYTHYWKGLKADGLEENAKEIVNVAMADGIKLGDGCGENEPVVEKGRICLNGWEADNEDYETFSLSDDTDFNFCKTARMPYDTVVVAILIDAILNSDYEYVHSDGDFEDWQYGIKLYEKAIRKLNEEDILKIRKAVWDYEETETKSWIDLVIEKAEEDGWKVRVDGNEFGFWKGSPAGQDFGFEVRANDLDELRDKVEDYYNDYDCSEEAYLWLDNTGHGKNGAPYDMKDLYEDMEACENMIWNLKVLLDEVSDEYEEDDEDE